MPVEGAAAVGIKSEEMKQPPATPSSRPKQSQAKSSATPRAWTLVETPREKCGQENRHHGYRGIWQQKSGRWASEIREPNRGKRHWVGTFATAVDAAIAYDKAAIAILGSRALVNFPSAFLMTANAPVPVHTSRTNQAQAKSSATPGARTPVVAPRGKCGQENRNHGYRGIWQRKSGRWASEIREPNRGKRHWVGTFATAVDAAIAHDKAAIAIFGSQAIVNFPSAFPMTADAPVQCYPVTCSPSAASTTVFGEHELKRMVTPSILCEHEMNRKVAVASIFDEHEVKPMISASVFSEGEVKPMVAASVLGEHEVKLLPAHSGGGGTEIAQHWDASWAVQEEVFAEYLNDIAMYIDADHITEKLAFHPDIKSEDYMVGLETEFADSPLWAWGD